MEDAFVDAHCYVYGTIPATPGYEDCTKLGFIAHMDTAPDFCGENVHPQIIENYDGKDVKLGESGRVLSVKQFPHLPSLKGRTLITTDGTTLLGADDKAGVAEIMTVVQELYEGRASATERFALHLHRMRRSAAAQICLISRALARITLIPWTAAMRRKSFMRILTPVVQNFR